MIVVAALWGIVVVCAAVVIWDLWRVFRRRP